MDRSWMGVGTDMFRPERANLVAAFRAISGNAEAPAGAPPANDSFVLDDSSTGAVAWMEERTGAVAWVEERTGAVAWVEERTGAVAWVEERTGAVAWVEERRALKHGRQYTGRFWLGRKGTIVGVAHSAQTVWCPGLRSCKRGRADRDFNGILKRTPWAQGAREVFRAGTKTKEWEGGMVR